MSAFSREKNCFSPQKININFAKNQYKLKIAQAFCLRDF